MGGWDLKKSRWANSYTIKKYGSLERVLELYEEHLLNSPKLMAALPSLKGKRLGCWCAPGRCHGDILASYADALED